MLDEFGFEYCQNALEESLLLFSCEDSYFNLEGVKLLLRRGASVHDRDELGNTCLHKCLRLINRSAVKGGVSNMRNAIIYLIQQGADVFAKNNCGLSVSDIAYTIYKDTIFDNRFREEIWDCALVSCGYNITDFRRPVPPANCFRPCRFTSVYFQELWADAEALRPVYDDEKCEIYFHDADDAVEMDEGSRQSEDSDDTDAWDSEDQLEHECEMDNGDTECSDSEDGGVTLTCDDDDSYHSRRCCPPYARVCAC